MVNVKVTFKHGSKTSTTTTYAVLPVDAKTESAVMAALRKRYPTYNNVIIVKME